MKALKLALAVTLVLAMVNLVACSDDDESNGGNNPPAAKPWEGTWLSAGANVAPILVTLFNYDSVRVTTTATGTVSLETHVAAGAWSTINGTYAVTESATGTVHAIAIAYPAFEQEGIIEVTTGTPDTMKLEVVQTVPDIGAVPRTPTSGFGSDPALGNINIQNYVRE